ncbi:MAG: hypothetical protein IJW75_04510 [Alphaproteobacteria bacterium]|nr:hypothetical protein [Alphaproteobacteria bacterium]
MIEIFHTLFRYREKESPDVIGAYPERVHVEAFPERRYLWTSRFLVMFSVMSICFNMMLASTIYLLLPQLSVYPEFYNINDYFSQIEMVQKREVEFLATDLIAEKNINDYLQLRFTISDNEREMKKRWRKGSSFYWLQAQSVYEEFVTSDMPNFINLSKKKKMQRYIEVQWIRPLSRGLWHAQIKSYDFFGKKTEPVISYWRVAMRIRYVKMNFRNKSTRSYNPYGFMVQTFSLAYHGREGDEESYIETARKRSQGK